jgi:hypothetical protein
MRKLATQKTSFRAAAVIAVLRRAHLNCADRRALVSGLVRCSVMRRAFGDEQVRRDARVETRIRARADMSGRHALRDRLCPRAAASDWSVGVDSVAASHRERPSHRARRRGRYRRTGAARRVERSGDRASRCEPS